MQIWPDTYTEWIAQCTGRNALAQYAEHANTYVL